MLPEPTLPVLSAAEAGTAEASHLQRWALVAGVALALWLVLALFSSILLPFVAASGIAYFLDPVAHQLTRLGVPRPVAALILIIGLIAVGLMVVLLLYPLIAQQVGVLVAHLPDYVLALRNVAQRLVTDLQARLGPDYVNSKLRDLIASQGGAVLSFVAQALTRLITGGVALFNVAEVAIVTPVVAFYLLRDWPRVVARADSWLPRRYAAVLRAQAQEVDRILSAWLRGQLLCCLFLALFYAAGLTLVGLDLGLIVGLAAGILSFIPYVGTITGATISTALALAQFPLWSGLIRVALVFVIGNQFETYVIYPRFLGDRVKLHAVWVIFALFAGGAAFGFLGILLAVPMAAVLGVLARFWLRRYLESPLYLDPPSARED
ncbi:MAG: AI-2E family transporter [Rhodospirillales bacterium]|nr:AI-2E family transporter [Rhodospirillales bacterium]